MACLRKWFKKESTASPSGSNKPSEAMPPNSQLPQLQGILVLSRDAMDQAAVLGLTQQILDDQKSRGHGVAEGFIAKHVAAGPDVDSDMYAYGKIRNEFSQFGGAEILNRTKVFPFHFPGGTSGKFYVIYDQR
jgi:hypothetical protein